MNGLKIKALIAAIIVAGAVLVATVTFIGKGKGGITTAQAGAKLAAAYNAGSQQARVVKVLRCLQGSSSSYLCAVAVTPDGTNVVCAKLSGDVTAKGKLSIVQADPAVCYFAS